MADATRAVTAAQAASLTASDLKLVQLTEDAIRQGGQLERWCRAATLQLFPLDLKKKFRLPNKAYGFFGNLQIDNTPRSVMGCRQEVEFARVGSAGTAAAALKEFVLGHFLPLAHWTYADGYPGGFTIQQSLYKNMSGEYGKFDASCSEGCVDWRKLGAEYEWVLLTVNIHDFVMDFGPVRKRFKEAACVVPHASFVHVMENPAPDEALEITVGYPFVEVTPIPNVFGFGPGKFGIAIKTYSFFLSHTGDVRVRMTFAAAPRCQKVFDFGRSIPDPVYGGAALLQRLTMERWNSCAFHDKLDSNMLAQHCRVHQALMDGVEKVWSSWCASQPA